jgi:hypothetical protein
MVSRWDPVVQILLVITTQDLDLDLDRDDVCNTKFEDLPDDVRLWFNLYNRVE